MSTELNSGTVGGFGHMGPNDPYNDGHSGSGSSGGSFNGGGNGGHDNSSGSSYTASFGLITGRHPITVPGTKNINSVDLSAVINNIIHHEGARNNMYLDTANNVTVGIGRMLPNSQAGYNLGFTKEGANKQVISSQADSLIKISRIWADFFPANTSNQPI